MTTFDSTILDVALAAAAAECRAEIDRHIGYERDKLAAAVAALHAAIPAAAEVAALPSKPTYAQVGELSINWPCCTLPFGYLSTGGGPQVNLARGYHGAIEKIAAALSEHKKGPLLAGRYRYAIMLFREEEKSEPTP